MITKQLHSIILLVLRIVFIMYVIHTRIMYTKYQTLLFLFGHIYPPFKPHRPDKKKKQNNRENSHLKGKGSVY